jgi:hypothetical protein
MRIEGVIAKHGTGAVMSMLVTLTKIVGCRVERIG